VLLTKGGLCLLLSLTASELFLQSASASQSVSSGRYQYGVANIMKALSTQQALAMHNKNVIETFLNGIQQVCGQSPRWASWMFSTARILILQKI
jgi:hypothetical protein